MSGWVALLRGINVGGHNKLPMAELRSLCEELGWDQVKTYIQSGNTVFHRTAGHGKELEEQLEKAIRRKFDYDITVIVRSQDAWAKLCELNPFPRESKIEPNRVVAALSKAIPVRPDSAVDMLTARAANGERILPAGDTVWVHFSRGQAGSKLSPALFEKALGSPVTARNWRTILKLKELVAETPAGGTVV